MEKFTETNGCGAADGLLRFVKVPHGKFFDCACNGHDIAYNKGGGILDKTIADLSFFRDMRMLIKEYFGQSKKRFWERQWFYIVAFLNYSGVALGGWFYFNWKRKKQ